MEQKLAKFSKLNQPFYYIAILILGYFFIPGALKYSIHNVLFRYEEIFFVLGIFLLSFFSYKHFNFDQKKLYKLSNLLIIYIYIVNIFYFYLIDNLQNNYLFLKLLHSYCYFFGLVNLFLFVFFFNNKTELILKIIYFTGILISFEFLFFIFLSKYFPISEVIYNNSYFEINSKKYLLFRSIFIGDHITTSLWAFLSLFAGFSKTNRNILDYIIYFLLIIITFFNFESKLNIVNAIFCIGIFIFIRFFNINLNLKKIFGFIILYILISLSLTIYLDFFYPNLINLSSFADRMVLNVFNIDTYFELPISLGFDNLQLHYIDNHNILLKKIAYFISMGGYGIGTISSLSSDWYFQLWGTITSPHNILMTYFSTMGFWFIILIIFFNRFSRQNFKFKNLLLLMIFNLIIFSFWNQIWHIDILFVLLISLVMNEGLKNEKN